MINIVSLCSRVSKGSEPSSGAFLTAELTFFFYSNQCNNHVRSTGNIRNFLCSAVNNIEVAIYILELKTPSKSYELRTEGGWWHLQKKMDLMLKLGAVWLYVMLLFTGENLGN